MSLILIGSTTYFLIAILTIAIVLIIFDHVKLKRKRNARSKEFDSEEPILPEAPGPKPWPILGSLHILGQYDVPYKAFAELVKIYKSPVLKMKMGSVNCIVVNGLENIKEVLFNKGAHFDSRPNFTRYHLLFSGNKENCKLQMFCIHIFFWISLFLCFLLEILLHFSQNSVNFAQICCNFTNINWQCCLVLPQVPQNKPSAAKCCCNFPNFPSILPIFGASFTRLSGNVLELSRKFPKVNQVLTNAVATFMILTECCQMFKQL